MSVVLLLPLLAQRVRIDRPPPGTLRRGWLGFDSPNTSTVLLIITVVLTVAIVGSALFQLYKSYRSQRRDS